MWSPSNATSITRTINNDVTSLVITRSGRSTGRVAITYTCLIYITLVKYVFHVQLVFNTVTAKWLILNFHPLEVVSRWRDPQLQVGENCLDLTKWSSAIFILLIDVTFYIWHVQTLICIGLIKKKRKNDYNWDGRVKEWGWDVFHPGYQSHDPLLIPPHPYSLIRSSTASQVTTWPVN